MRVAKPGRYTCEATMDAGPLGSPLTRKATVNVPHIAWFRPQPAPAIRDITRRPGVHQVAIAGDPRDVLFGVFGEVPDFEAHVLAASAPGYLQQFDLVVIQDFRASRLALAVPEELRAPLHQRLRRYVDQGGALLIAHKALIRLGNPFPDIMAGIKTPPGVPAFEASFVDGKTMTVADDSLKGFAPGERFDLHWGPHPVLRPGPRGRVILRDADDGPTAIVGQQGRGRVALVGPHLGQRADPMPREREFTLSLSRWLVSE